MYGGQNMMSHILGCIQTQARAGDLVMVLYREILQGVRIYLSNLLCHPNPFSEAIFHKIYILETGHFLKNVWECIILETNAL